MPSDRDATDAPEPRYNLRKRAKITTSAAAEVHQNVQQDPQDDPQGDEYDDPGEAYAPTGAGSGPTATTRKRKRASPGGNTMPQGSIREAVIQPTEVEDTSGSLEKMMELPLDLIYEVRSRKVCSTSKPY